MRRIWAIADTHLSIAQPKPMTIFGDHWHDHPAKIEKACHALVGPGDLLLIPGDISWAMKRAEAEADLDFLAALPGIKILCKGNHDYWWDSDRSLNFPGLHSTPYISEDGQIGVAGTRGWHLSSGTEAEQAKDAKITAREVERLSRRLEAIAACPIKIAMVHYPPLAEFSALLHKYEVKTILYGHLHLNGKDYPLPEKWQGIRALCVASDRLHFTPRLITSLPD